jgi:hypothetical protein
MTMKRTNKTAAAVAEPPALVTRLADLEQTTHVLHARTTVSNWPLLPLRAFLGQSADDEELQRTTRLFDRAFEDALRLLGTWEGHREHVDRLRALNAAVDGPHENILGELLTQTVLTLGICYGIRLASEAAGGAK